MKLCRFDRFVRFVKCSSLTIRQVELSIGKLHLISGTLFLWQSPSETLLIRSIRQMEYFLTIRQVELSIGKLHLISGTIFLWQSPSVTLSIRSIRSIRQMGYFFDDPASGFVYRKYCCSFSGS